MPVTITSTLQDAELAYGRGIVTCFNGDGGSNRIVLQVFDASDNSKIADLRQLPNAGSYSHFDISRILQSKVSQTPDPEGDTGNTIRLFTNPDECFDYYLKVGTLNATTGVVTIDTTYSASVVDDYLVIPGRKQVSSTGETYWEDYNDYVPQISTNPVADNAVIPEVFQKALTDRHYDTIRVGDITDGAPSPADFSNDDEELYVIKVYRGTDHSLQFLQRWIDGLVGGGAPDYYNGVNYFRFQGFSGSVQQTDTNIVNLVSNNGGPNVTYDDQSTPTGEYGVIGCKSGFNNATLATTTTHMYVWVEAQRNDNFILQDGARISKGYRIEVEEPECNDYDLIQVKWLNSLGGTDYFTFQKKNEERISVKRNTYQSTNQDWAGSSWSEYPYDRGERVYNQSGETVYTANTRYLSDNENAYLKNLYLSPDVKVKFGTGDNSETGGWNSVVLTSNTWTERSFRKDKLFQHTINFKMANKINLQGG